MKLLHIGEARWGEVWKAALVWALAAGAMAALDDRVDLANLAMLLLLASALAGLWLRAWLAMLASALAVLVFNWAFVPPRHTLQVDLRRDALLLGVMLAVSWIVTVLMARQRDTAALAREQAARAGQLRSLGEALRDADDPRTQAHRLHAALQALNGGPVRLLLLKAPPPPLDDPGAETWLGGDPDADVRTGAWLCLRQQAAMGPGTGRHDDELNAWYLPLRGRGVAFGAAWIALDDDMPRDDTTRAQAQALCDQMGQALSRAHALASAHEARSQAQDQAVRNALLAAISHDFRTPLATIMGAASSLQEQDARLSPGQRRRLADTIVDEAGQLARLTDNTLQLARLDAPGGVALSLDWESAEELVGAVLRRARRRDPARRLRARLEPGLPLLRCDAMLLTQLLENLVDNALKYGDEAAPVELLVRRQGEHVVLAVRDRGPGVPPAWREKVFQVFRRGEATPLAGTRPGVGVGLAVCRAIARAHGGELRLRPRGHGGTAFECYVVTAASLSEGLALARHAAPDLVLLDLGLPDGDGETLLADLRRRTALPVLVISARESDGQKIRLLDGGADDYLVKPFAVGELLARMRVALRHRGLAARPAVTRYEHDGLAIDLQAHRVSLRGEAVHLTPTEFKLLARLVRSAGQVVTHRQLLADVWGPDCTEQTHYLRLYMSQLRAKLEADPAEPQRLLTEPGVGYRLAEPGAI